MRYLPLADADRQEMLRAVGASSIDELFVDVPEAARLRDKIEGLPDHLGEMAVERELGRLSRRNLVAGDVPFFLGCGAYRHHVPASVDHLIQRGEFLTSYTPYQPEVSQGTLQALFELDRKSTRLNSSHSQISYAVFCLKKKKKQKEQTRAVYIERYRAI